MNEDDEDENMPSQINHDINDVKPTSISHRG